MFKINNWSSGCSLKSNLLQWGLNVLIKLWTVTGGRKFSLLCVCTVPWCSNYPPQIIIIIFMKQEKQSHNKIWIHQQQQKRRKTGYLKSSKTTVRWWSSHLRQLLHSGNLWFWSADPHTSEQLSWPAYSQEIQNIFRLQKKGYKSRHGRALI